MAPPSRPSDRHRADGAGRRVTADRSGQRRRPDGGGSGAIRRAPVRPMDDAEARPTDAERATRRRNGEPSPPRRRAAGTTAHPEAHRLTTRTDTTNTVLGPRNYTPRRIGLLAVIAIMLLVTLSFPLRNHYQYKSELQEVSQEKVALQRTIDELEAEQQMLGDPKYVEQQARIRFGAVKPGETPYRISQVDPVEKAEREKAAAELAALPWQTRVWRSVSEPQAPVMPEGAGE